MMTRTLSAVAALALTAGTLALSTPAHAASGEVGVTVRYGDLDLGSAAGKARFDRRVRNAARAICGSTLRQPLNMQTQIAACQEEVIAGAQADLETALGERPDGTRLALRGN